MSLDDAIERAAEYLAASQHAVALTGAGISTPSGIPDFRSPLTGLWEHADPLEVASIDAFHRNPRAFYDWIRPLARRMAEARPNPAHVALAELERMGILKAVCTQNIDELHYRAGSTRVLELHGSTRQATCTRCGKRIPGADLWPHVVEQGLVPQCPCCEGVVKPDVVLYGELLPEGVLMEAQLEAGRCDVMLVVGSSLEVYPAAELPFTAKRHGARVISVDYQPTALDARADVVIRSDVAAALPRIVGRVSELRRMA